MLIGFLYELHKNSIWKKNYEGNLLPAETLPNQFYVSSKCTRIKVIDFQDFCNQFKKWTKEKTVFLWEVWKLENSNWNP